MCVVCVNPLSVRPLTRRCTLLHSHQREDVAAHAIWAEAQPVERNFHMCVDSNVTAEVLVLDNLGRPFIDVVGYGCICSACGVLFTGSYCFCSGADSTPVGRLSYRLSRPDVVKISRLPGYLISCGTRR